MAFAIGSDMTVSLNALFDNVSQAYVNNATVTASLVQVGINGQASSTLGGPYTLTYVSSSSGNYQGQIPASVTANMLPSSGGGGTYYRVVITATVSGNTANIVRTDSASYTEG